MSVFRPASACAPLLLVVASTAQAQFWDFTIDPMASGLTGAIALDGATSGSLMGDYDPDTNPGGTRTRQTSFPLNFPGPTQNDAVPASIGFGVDFVPDVASSGSFSLGLSGSDVLLSGLSVDLLDGASLSVPVNADVSFSSFTTANPTFFYPAVPVSVPVGEVSLDALRATQTGGPVLGSATPDGMGGFDVLLSVPVELSGSATFMGQTFPLDAFPALLPVAGTLTTDPGSAFFMGGADIVLSESMTIDMPIPDFPLELPTLGAESASVVLSLTLDDVSLDLDLDIAVGAGGVEVPAPGVLALFGLAGVVRRRRVRG